MKKEWRVLSLLALILIVSGCIDGGEPQGSLTVTELTITPTEIMDGGEVRATLEAVNTGTQTAEVDLGENGRNLIDDHCSDRFTLVPEQFSAVSSRTTDTKERYTLSEGQSIRANWLFKNEEGAPDFGYDCDFRFRMPFNYSVTAFNQVQVKRDREVESATSLQYKSTSGPLRMSVSAGRGITSERGIYIAPEQDGDDRSARISLGLVNEEPEEEINKGLVNIEQDTLSVEATGPIKLNEELDNGGNWSTTEDATYSEPRCDDVGSDIRLYEGEFNNIECIVPLPTESELDQPGQISEVSANVNYTYIKDAGSRNVEVESR